MSESVSARLIIEVVVDCPHCEGYLDIMNPDDTCGYSHNEEGDVISQACPDGSWYDKHKEFRITNITCSNCGKSFDIEGLEW